MAVLPPPRILNAGGSTELRRARSEVLHLAGFEVIETEGGSECLSKLATERPDLIVVATLKGAEFEPCNRLKGDPASLSIPVISISETSGDPHEAARVLNGGADTYLVEPVHPEHLVAAVRALLRFSRVERLSTVLNRVNAAIASTLDFEQIMQRVVVEAAREIGSDSTCILLLEGNEWVVKYSFGLPDFVGERIPERPEVPGSISAQARGKKPFIIGDNSRLPPDEREILERHSIHTKLLVPLRVRAQLIGLIGFHYHTPRTFDALQVDFAAKLGAAVSIALENARLFSEAEEKRKLLDALMQHIPHGIAIADVTGRELRMVSDHGRELTGSAQIVHNSLMGEAVPPRWQLLRPGSEVPAEASDLPLIRAIRGGSPVTNEEWLLEKVGGERIPILVDAGPIRGVDGQITGGVVAWQDISTRKRLEKELLNARQMEAIGLLAGGIAHEFNNMLTVITGHCQLLLDSSRSAKVQEHLQPVLDAAARLTSLTSQLLGFAGRQLISPSPLCLNATLERMRAALQQLLGDGYLLETDLDPALKMVKADVGQVEQVILSLVLHARDSMPGGGNIEITTGNIEIGGPENTWCCEVPAGKYAMLCVSDHGPGMPPETAERLFEPFFGHKAIGKGAGLALSATYGAVKQNRGGIKVVSQMGEGTRFQVCLPQIQA